MAEPCPEPVVGAIVKFRHKYEDDGTMSPWKQGIVIEIKPDSVVVDVIHPNGMKELLVARKPDIRNAKLLVRSVDHQTEFYHVKGKAHGQSFSSTCVVSPDCLVTFGGNVCTTLVMSIGFETNIVGGSAHNLGSGGQPLKNFIQDHEIQAYLGDMKVQYIMEDYAQQFKCCQSARTSSNQLELMSWLFEDWSPVGKSFPTCHNEVLTNLHPDMILGVLFNTSNPFQLAAVCKDFAEQFGRELRVITIQDNLFVVEQK